MIRQRSKVATAGFSLVELMVVVAIIGVLAAVAVPRINRFINKARTTEAQVNLGSLYTFNKNFFVEFQSYTTNFQMMGYLPEGRLRYNTGFSVGLAPALTGNYIASGRTAPNPLHISTLAFCIPNGGQPTALNPCSTINGADNAQPAAIPGATGCTVGPNTTVVVAAPNPAFVASANAVLGTRNIAAVPFDEWQINELKALQNCRDGTD